MCHAAHDVTYSKHGSFFCDCGAKEDSSCMALVKRTSSATMLENERPSMTSASAASNVGYEPMLTSSLRRRPSSPGKVFIHKSRGEPSLLIQPTIQLFLSSPSALRTSGASRNRDYWGFFRPFRPFPQFCLHLSFFKFFAEVLAHYTYCMCTIVFTPMNFVKKIF